MDEIKIFVATGSLEQATHEVTDQANAWLVDHQWKCYDGRSAYNVNSAYTPIPNGDVLYCMTLLGPAEPTEAQ